MPLSSAGLSLFFFLSPFLRRTPFSFVLFSNLFTSVWADQFEFFHELLGNQVFAACLSAPVHQLYGYTVTTPELRTTLSRNKVWQALMLREIDSWAPKVALLWRSLPAAEQREKMVSQHASEKLFSIESRMTFEDRFCRICIRCQGFSKSSTWTHLVGGYRSIIMCHVSLVALDILALKWALCRASMHFFFRTRLSSLVPRDLFMRSMYVAVAYTMRGSQYSQ